MTSDIVSNFLNVAGIVGFAVIDRTHLHDFCNSNVTLQPVDKISFVQNLVSVFGSIPTEFYQVELHLEQHWVYLYRLDRERLFGVWLEPKVDHQHYQAALALLLPGLQHDLADTMAQLRAQTISWDSVDVGHCQLSGSAKKTSLRHYRIRLVRYFCGAIMRYCNGV